MKLETHWHNPTDRYGVGVSGGGDSLALLHLLVSQFGPQNFHAILVNHGWNAAFAKRSATAAQKLCSNLGVPLSVIVAAGGKPQTNPEAAARKHRYAAFAKVAAEENLHAILLGHTRTDNVEQFLMRAAKGSGLTGLSGIPAEGHYTLYPAPYTLRILRPMLNLSREQLRAYLKKHKIQWVEDPGNAASTRGKIRAKLKGDWLGEEAVAASIAALGRAEDALEHHTQSLLEKHIVFMDGAGGQGGKAPLRRRPHPGEGRDPRPFSSYENWACERDWLLNLPEEIALRLLAKLVKSEEDDFAPRTSKRQTLLNAIMQKSKGTATLGACKIEWRQGALKATRLKP